MILKTLYAGCLGLVLMTSMGAGPCWLKNHCQPISQVVPWVPMVASSPVVLVPVQSYYVNYVPVVTPVVNIIPVLVQRQEVGGNWLIINGVWTFFPSGLYPAANGYGVFGH